MADDRPRDPDADPDADDPGRDSINTQWVGLAVVLVALALAVASSLGWAVLSIEALRTLLIAGILLLGGREVILAVLERAP